MCTCFQDLQAALLVAVVTAGLSGVARAADPAAEYRELMTSKSPALVTVKFVLKMKGGFMGDQETESEATGVMIDPKGLVLCSNTQLGGFASLFGRFGGGMSASPTDIKVLVGRDTEGVEAKLLARDTELDLAWVQITEPAEKGYASIDFSKSAKPRIGQRLLCVRRMGKFFDRVPAVSEGRVGGTASKPRDLYVPAGGLAEGLGLPVFTVEGQVVGVLVTQMPDPDEMEMSPQGMFGNPFSFRDMMAGVILPAEQVVKATKRARETAKGTE